MGFGKSLKKAFKKVAKIAGNPLGGGNDEKPREVAPEVQPAPIVQTTTEVAKKDTDQTDDSDTEAAKKKARAGGKKGLSVARSSGSGLNI